MRCGVIPGFVSLFFSAVSEATTSWNTSVENDSFVLVDWVAGMGDEEQWCQRPVPGKRPNLCVVWKPEKLLIHC